MDQLKPILAALRQHSFWIMCGGILLVSLGSWWYSTSQLAAAREANASKIKGAKDALTALSGKTNHPNEATKQGMEQILTAYRTEVDKAWSEQYEGQRDVLVWPSVFDEEFRSTMNELRPIEKLPYPTPISQEIGVGQRRIYRDFILDVLPSLAEKIGSKWTADSQQIGTSGEGSGGATFGGPSLGPMGPMGYSPDGSSQNQVVDTSVVFWSSQNQQDLLSKHFSFAVMVDAPTTLQVLYAQEDLWVFQALMDIIAATNEGATARHEAAIKAIDTLAIGKNALGFAGAVTPIGAPAGGASPTGEVLMNPMGSPMGASPEGTMPGGTSGMNPDGSPAALGSGDPADGRYVDDKFMPIPATRLREALNPANAKAEDALLAVAKRVPVRLRFLMDQRKLNLLLTECGNSKLPLEVRQVRINRPAGQTSSGGGGAEGFSSAPMGLMGGGGVPGGEGMMPGAGYGGQANRSTISDATYDANVLPVEIYGIIYIYNPVNKQQLGIPVEPPATTTAQTDPAAPALPAATTTPDAATTPAATAPAATVPAATTTTPAAAPAAAPAVPVSPTSAPATPAAVN